MPWLKRVPKRDGALASDDRLCQGQPPAPRNFQEQASCRTHTFPPAIRASCSSLVYSSPFAGLVTHQAQRKEAGRQCKCHHRQCGVRELVCCRHLPFDQLPLTVPSVHATIVWRLRHHRPIEAFADLTDATSLMASSGGQMHGKVERWPRSLWCTYIQDPRRAADGGTTYRG